MVPLPSPNGSRRPRRSGSGILVALLTLASSLAMVTAPGAGSTVQAAALDLLIHPHRGWSDSAFVYENEPDGRRILYECRAALAGGTALVYGTNRYEYTSRVCFAAVHVGAITMDGGGPVVIEMGPPQASYVGSTRNSVTSQSIDDVLPHERSFAVLEHGSVELPPEYEDQPDLPRGTLVVEQSELDLGAVRVGEQASATLTVRNAGPGPLTVFAIELDAHEAGQFHLRDNTVTTSPLAPGEQRTVRVEFAPTTAATGPPQLTSAFGSLHGMAQVISSPGTGHETHFFAVENLGGTGSVSYTATCGTHDFTEDRTTGSLTGSFEVVAGARYRLAVRVTTSGSARESWVVVGFPDQGVGREVRPLPLGQTVPAFVGVEEVRLTRRADAALLLTSDDPAYQPDDHGGVPLGPGGEVVWLFATALPADATVPPPGQQPPEEQPPHDGTFVDVDLASTHAAAIERAVELGLTRGVSTDPPRFAPGSSVRRDQAASFIARLLEHGPTPLPDAGPAGFGDLDGNVHAGAINRLAAVGVLRGITPDAFGPGMPVTRAQMTSLLVQALRWSTGEELLAAGGPYFPDVAGVHAANIDVAHELGLASGRADGSFGPGLDVRRDQLASLLVRTYDQLVQD